MVRGATLTQFTIRSELSEYVYRFGGGASAIVGSVMTKRHVYLLKANQTACAAIACIMDFDKIDSAAVSFLF
jgi:hypothetical protein